MSLDVAGLTEVATITRSNEKDELLERGRELGLIVWEGRAVVEKFHGDEAFHAHRGARPYEVTETEPNLLLTAGAGLIWSLLTGGAGTAFSSANAHIAVGDSTTAVAAGQTDLQAATNKVRQLVSGAPSLSTNQAVFAATFGTGAANFAWQEWGVANASTGGVLLNRVVSSLGTKTSSASWTLTATLSLA